MKKATKPEKSGTTGYSKRQAKAPYLFTLPYFSLFGLFSIFPILYSLGIAFTDWEGVKEPSYIGFRNFIALVQDDLFWKAIGNNFLFILMILPIQLFLAFIIAVILTNRQMMAKKLYRIFIFLPYLTTPIALGLIFGILFDSSSGYVNSFLQSLGISAIPWTTKTWPSRMLVSMITIWRWMGYTSVIFMAGITNISTDVFEAAQIDGAGFWKTIRYITAPLLKPIMVFIILTNMIGNFQIFEEPYMVFSIVAGKLFGGPNYADLTGMWYFYNTAFEKLKYGYGASIGVGLFAIIAIVSFITNKLLKRGEM